MELKDDLTVLENPAHSIAAAKARDKITHNLLHHGLASSDYKRLQGVGRRSTRLRVLAVAGGGQGVGAQVDAAERWARIEAKKNKKTSGEATKDKLSSSNR